MDNEIQFPLDHMREKAQAMQNETASLTDETNSHVQQMQQHHSSLPSSMQGAFGDFIGTMQQRLSNGLALRQQMHKRLNEAASVAEDSDSAVAQGFGDNKTI